MKAWPVWFVTIGIVLIVVGLSPAPFRLHAAELSPHAAELPPRAATGAAPRTVAAPAAAPADAPAPPTFAALGDDAVTALLRVFYAGDGTWRDCPQARCRVHNGDWGSDALTQTLFLRWTITRDESLVPIFRALATTARRYPAPCEGPACLLWSDVPLWDAVALAHEHAAMPGDVEALVKARRAFEAVEGSRAYARGACPEIRYQRPYGRGTHLKTLETDSNGVAAALALYDATREERYLQSAVRRYAAVRRHFLDPQIPLYTVYVFDDGRTCAAVPHRFFASVNGNMISNGLELYRFTRMPEYRAQAVATARAVATRLGDGHGVFANLQAENDVAEPLVAAMLDLADREGPAFAREWIVASASAAFSARKGDGTYGRFFDGPPPAATVTAWQANGGFAAEIAAASLAGDGVPEPASWTAATYVPHEIARLPASIRFRGRGFALVGTLGEVCCEAGHARVFVDGVETASGIGTWQNKSSSGQRLPGSVLFAWRFRAAGPHVVTLAPGRFDAKEGGSYLHARGYLVSAAR